MHNASSFQPGPVEGVPKVIGADVELANFIEGIGENGRGSAAVASRLLLREIPGVPQYPYTARTTTGYNAQDWGRKFLPTTGGSAYIDLDHLELPLPEVRSARDFVAAWHAALLIARQAMKRANLRLEGQSQIHVLANNSDGLGHSYGSHLNFLITRRTYDNLFHRRPLHMLYLAAFQASSIVITGQGKVGAENGAPPVDYQLSQRADFIETTTGLQTTYNRPMVNTRDEPLCGPAGRSPLARLHVIFYDSNLCHVANLLKVGMLQIVLAMIEADQVNSRLVIDDMIEGVIRWSHDPELRTRVRMGDRRHLTAVETQWEFFAEAERFVASGGCTGLVPDAEEIVQLWGNVLEKLSQRDFDQLSDSLDWVLKRRCLQRALHTRPELTWRSPEMKHLDHLYSSLDPDAGLYWACERAGAVRCLVPPAVIRRFCRQPPTDTRAWTRAMLLRLAGPDRISFVDWDQIRFCLPGRWGWPVYHTLWLRDPTGLTRRETRKLILSGAPLEEILDRLDQLQADETSDGSDGQGQRGAADSAANRTTLAIRPLDLTSNLTQPSTFPGDSTDENA